MSLSPLDQFDSAHVVPLIYMLLLAFRVPSNTAMIVCSIVWAADFVTYASQVVLDLADFLHVDVFRIDSKPPVAEATAH